MFKNKIHLSYIYGTILIKIVIFLYNKSITRNWYNFTWISFLYVISF